MVFFYRFCIALEEMSSSDLPVALLLGCGAPVTVKERVTFATVVPVMVNRTPVPNHLR